MTRVPFEGRRVIITEKMDGENTTMYPDHIHARSLDSVNHPSRDWVKSFWSTFNYLMPKEMRVCGENMFAQHSIAYDDLDSYFLGFSVWDGDTCLDWDDTTEWFKILGISSVPLLYDGMYNRDILDGIWSSMDPNKNEGYVVRLADSFERKDFGKSVGKYVRANHVQTDELWMLKPIIPNKLKR